jgi:hypothetical protein
MSHDAIRIGIDLSADEHNRLDQIAAKSGIYQLLARAGVPKPLADQMMAKPIGPMIGQTVRFRDGRGRDTRAIVCAPDDPRRSGTYTSQQHGEIPTRPLEGNRKARRIAQAQAR